MSFVCHTSNRIKSDVCGVWKWAAFCIFHKMLATTAIHTHKLSLTRTIAELFHLHIFDLGVCVCVTVCLCLRKSVYVCVRIFMRLYSRLKQPNIQFYRQIKTVEFKLFTWIRFVFQIRFCCCYFLLPMKRFISPNLLFPFFAFRFSLVVVDFQYTLFAKYFFFSCGVSAIDKF